MEEVCEHFGTHISDYYFLEMVENDSYVRLWCDDEGLDYLEDVIDWEAKHGSVERFNKIKNDFALVKYLRDELGIRDETVLVWVCW